MPDLRPDVVGMDTSIPILTGVQGTEWLQRECSEVKVLALTVYEDQGYISVKTVETYRTRSMEKLGLKSRAELVGYAVQQDWLQKE